MVKDFQDKQYWAVILGGSSGLGLATAKKLAEHGMHICIIHRNRRSELQKIGNEFEEIRKSGVQLLTFNEDAFKAENRAEMIDVLKRDLGEKGKVRTLVHSIAKGNLKPMVSDNKPNLKNEDFHLTIDAMAISLYDWVTGLFEAGIFASDSRVISFTSEGNSKAWKNYAAVSAAKTALEAITRNIALELAPYGVRANCIQAGVTDTESLRAIPGSEILKEQSQLRNPFKRLTTPKDVANAVYLMCKDEASWINGCIIPVDGGEHIS